MDGRSPAAKPRAEDLLRNIGGAAAIAALGLSGAACSPDEYRPLADDEVVVISVYGYSAPFVRDGVEYRGDAEAYIQKTDPSNAFGVRELGDGEYLPDTFVVHSGLEAVELRCFLWRDSYPEDDLIAAMCRGYFSRAEPGQAIQVRFNDFDGSEVVMPELPELTTPAQDSEFSLGSGEDLVLSWEPLGTDDQMGWSLGPASYDDLGPCVTDVSWGRSDGVTEDTGSFVIPRESYPTDLPAEGCQALLRFDRGRLGTTDPAIQQGSIFAHQVHQVRITLKP